MNEKKFLAGFAIVLLAASCSSIPLIPPSQPGIQSTASPTPLLALSPSSTPTALPTLAPATETITPETAVPIASEPVDTTTTLSPLDFKIPIFPGAQDIAYDFLAMMDQSGNTVYYSVSVTPNEIQAFYMEELTQDGWEWVYTDTDESLSIPFPFPAWIMEFKKDGHKLGIGALSYGGEGSVILAGVNFSGGTLISNYIGAIAGGLDLMGPFESNAGPDAMRFSSVLLEFKHPAEWQARDQSMQFFDSDHNVYYAPNTNNCSVDMDPCFVNFSASPNFHFDISVSIRLHSEMAGMTLEEANTKRWEELNSIASDSAERYLFPEDLALAGSLESTEVRNILLADGLPALQRVYRWKQKDVAEYIVSTYTLFTSAGVLVEFHTDFMSSDWEKIHRTIVEQVIASIKTIQ